MDRDTLNKLRLDKRLALRRGWIAPDDLDRELEALPDVSNKIAPADSSAAAEPAGAGPNAR